ncbi:DUF6463 family protein [Thalassotalea marina]|uniref:Uncharacterized protein n=1 Tax=Thalassotalea marina TaxID=1673741 RepID=A0A919EMS9_9GAMM|nr:DUF6463 family protein [Thalassotalea marina]GHG01256.1 hypothetical protein GCM10017161_32390 [Thalassotalea marina]
MKYSGYYLFATGVLHNLIGFVMGWPVLLDMSDAGWISSTIVDGQVLFDREAISWFLITGFFWMAFGLTLQKAIDQGFVPPISLGLSFIVIGVIVAFIMPISGAYLFIIQGIVLLIGANKAQITVQNAG